MIVLTIGYRIWANGDSEHRSIRQVNRSSRLRSKRGEVWFGRSYPGTLPSDTDPYSNAGGKWR